MSQRFTFHSFTLTGLRTELISLAGHRTRQEEITDGFIQEGRDLYSVDEMEKVLDAFLDIFRHGEMLARNFGDGLEEMEEESEALIIAVDYIVSCMKELQDAPADVNSAVNALMEHFYPQYQKNGRPLWGKRLTRAWTRYAWFTREELRDVIRRAKALPEGYRNDHEALRPLGRKELAAGVAWLEAVETAGQDLWMFVG